jgi:hypothetical protein
VFVATFMKSGTSWMMQIASQIAWRGAAEFEHVSDVIPWPDSPGAGFISLDDPRSWEGSPTELRVIKTHCRSKHVPLDPKARYIVVLRDPKEVLVSSYFFALPLLGLADTISPQTWMQLMAADAPSNGWLEHALGWWALRDEPNVLVLFYGEMKRDPDTAIQQVADLMGSA